MKHWKYLKYILRHKWYVALECFKHGLYWRGLVHDLSKLWPSEWAPYAEFLYGEGSPEQTGNAVRDLPHTWKQVMFDVAWLQHIHRNPHHWRYWMLQEDSRTLKLLEMPWLYIVEMVCDWEGASKALRGPNATARKWYLECGKARVKLAPGTRQEVEQLLGLVNIENQHGRRDG